MKNVKIFPVFVFVETFVDLDVKRTKKALPRRVRIIRKFLAKKFSRIVEMSEKNYISNRRAGIASPFNKYGWARRLIENLMIVSKRRLLDVLRRYMGHAIVAEGFQQVFPDPKPKLVSLKRHPKYETCDIATMSNLVFMKVFIEIGAVTMDPNLSSKGGQGGEISVKSRFFDKSSFLKNTEVVVV